MSFFALRVALSAGFAGRLRQPLAQKTFRKRLLPRSDLPA
jgi:hypothetical protein